jgi:dihydrofolate synthase / folylpolyglutamate synthase
VIDPSTSVRPAVTPAIVPGASAERGGGIARRVVPVPMSPLEALVDRRRGTARRGSHRAQALCEELGSPHLTVPTVHVAGTNGKTSVVRMTASLLASLGIRAGDTTSPHLHHLGERIRLDGRPVAPAVLATATAHLPDAIERSERRTGEPVTFFDAVTAVALQVFAQQHCRVAVVEAGIGGTGDATDVVQGPVSVLTPIGLDHPELGTTHAEVAANKSGIVRPGGVVLTAVQHPEAMAEIERTAAGQGASLLYAGRDVAVEARRHVDGGQVVDLVGLDGRRLRTLLPLYGASHADNAALALGAVQAVLGTSDLDPARLRAGFAAVRVPGRMEIVRCQDGPSVVLDGAHDPQASTALAATLEEPFAGVPGAIVAGTTAGRDLVPVLAPMLGRFARPPATVVTTAAKVPGATPPQLLARRLSAAGWDAVAVPDVTDALALAMTRVGAGGVVAVTGSMYVVAEARRLLARSQGLPLTPGTVTV